MANSGTMLARLETLHPKEIDLSLGRVRRLAERLGNPQDRLPPIVHVAGTNGKGSVIAFLEAMLQAAGKQVHTFTSPHLMNFHERIRLAGPSGAELISEDVLFDVLKRVEEVNQGEPITYFEITTLAAFVAFSEAQADVLLLETGLGGRLDATNIIRHPALTVITPISIDHTRFLGKELKEIAREKAGILKTGVPCVVARQSRSARIEIENCAQRLDVPLIVAGQDWDAFEQEGRMIYQNAEALLDLPLPRLQGRHQIENAATAISAARHLDFVQLSERHIEKGLVNAVWPGRLDRLGPGRLYSFVEEGSEIWLDGGHNPGAANVLAQFMAELEERVPRPLHLVCGMMVGKDAAAFFQPFQGLAECVFTITIPGQKNACSAETLAQIAQEAGLDATPSEDLVQALVESRNWAGEPVRILICGSLYMTGHVYLAHDSEGKLD